MKIDSIDKTPCHYLPHYSSQPRGRAAARRMLPFYKGTASLPDGLSCVVLASDLQGRESIGGRLLGEAVADALRDGVTAGTWSAPDRIFLCGDLYDAPNCDKRGASGPVDPVCRGLTIFGHAHWPDDDGLGWFVEIGEGLAVNVDGRVVILETSDV